MAKGLNFGSRSNLLMDFLYKDVNILNSFIFYVMNNGNIKTN